MSNYGKELSVFLQLDASRFQKAIANVSAQATKATANIDKSFDKLGGKMSKPFYDAANKVAKQAEKMEQSSSKSVRGIGTVFEKVGSGIKKVASGIDSKVSNTFSGMRSASGKAFDTMKAQAIKFKDKVNAEVDKMESKSEESFRSMGNSFKSFVSGAIGGYSLSSFFNSDGGEISEVTKGMAKLTTAFEANGSSAEQGKRVYNELYNILGDSDRAVEASQLMAKMTTDTQSMTEWTNIATGVLGTFGDALPIESMIESANETARVGAVTGTLADALNWAGVSEDAFNEKLAKCSSTSEREALIRTTLNDLYQESADIYKTNNEELINYNDSQESVAQKMAGLEQALLPLKTAFNDFKASVIDKITPVLVAFSNEVLPTLQSAFSFVGDAISAAYSKISEWFNSIDWNAVLTSLQEIGGYLADAFTPAWNTLKDAFNGVVDIFKSAWEALFGEDATSGDAILTTLDKLKSACKWFADNGELVEAGLVAVAAGFVALKVIQTLKNLPTIVAKVVGSLKGIIALVSSPVFLIVMAVAVVVGLVWYYWDEIKAFFNKCVDKCKEWWNAISTWFKDLWTTIKDLLAAIKDFFVGIWETIEPYITFILEIFEDVFTRIWKVIKTVFTTIWKFFTFMFELWWTLISKVMEVIWVIITEVWKKIWEFIQPIIQAVWEWISEKWNAIKEAITAVCTAIWDKIVSIWSSIWDKIVAICTAIWDKIVVIWTSIKNFFAPVVNFIREKVTNGFNKVKDKAIDIFTKIKDKITEKVNALKDVVTGLPDKMKDGLSKGKNKIANVFKDMFNNAIGFVEGGVNKVLSGVRWIMNKLDLDSSKITNVSLPRLAKGTAGWNGGTALVGEAGRELVHDAGRTFLVNDATLLNLSRGAKVLSNPKTEKLLRNSGIPAFAKGKNEGWFSSFTGAVSDIWGYISNPSSLVDLMFEKLGIGKGDNFISKGISSWIKSFKNKVIGFVKGIFGKATPSGADIKSVEGWKPLVLKAASFFGDVLTDNELARVLQQIRTESGGNAGLTQSMAVWDVNAKSGNLARGLLQYVPSTFNSYKVSGFGNIWDGYHQLLAFFNNSAWRKNLPQLGEKRGWTPRGKRRKAKNGILVNGATPLTIGEAGQEAVVPLSNASALKPFGQAVMNALKEETDLTNGGYYEFTIPLYIDGKEVARATAQFTQEELNKMEKRNNRLHGRR